MRKSICVFLIMIFIAVSCNASDTGPQKDVYDVIVIGAGGGGLGAAARLAIVGKKVLVLEQHEKVGGYMTNFKRGDYSFEVSLHAFDGLNQGGYSEAMFKKLKISDKVKPVKLNPMYRSLFPDMTIEIPADANEYKKLLKEKFPNDADGIDGLFGALDRINRAMQSLMYFNDGRYGKGTWSCLKQFWIFGTLMRYWNATLADLLNNFIKDEKLFAVFTQLSGFLGDEPERISGMAFAMMWNSYHRGGYYYFEGGGSQSVSDALASVIKEHGGEIKLSTLATKIIIKDEKAQAVQTKDGSIYKCRYVVSNANVPDTFFKLVGKENVPEKYIRKINDMKIAATCFVVYMGVKRDYSSYFPKDVHEIMVNTSYSQRENYKRANEGDYENMPYAIANYSQVDPTASAKGKNAICITTIMPYDWNNGWFEKEDYKKYNALKEKVAKALIKRAETVLPDLSRNIEVMEAGSPRTMEHFTLNPKGSILGWANTPGQSMLKRLPQETPIDNLYLAGAWTFPCGGQSAVIMSGIMAAEKILDADD